MSLAKFVAQQNKRQAQFAAMGWNHLVKPDINIKALTPENKAFLAEELAGALTPECLTCDGEIRGAKLAAKTKLLYAAKADLEALGVAVPAY